MITVDDEVLTVCHASHRDTGGAYVAVLIDQLCEHGVSQTYQLIMEPGNAYDLARNIIDACHLLSRGGAA